MPAVSPVVISNITFVTPVAITQWTGSHSLPRTRTQPTYSPITTSPYFPPLTSPSHPPLSPSHPVALLSHSLRPHQASNPTTDASLKHTTPTTTRNAALNSCSTKLNPQPTHPAHRLPGDPLPSPPCYRRAQNGWKDSSLALPHTWMRWPK